MLSSFLRNLVWVFGVLTNSALAFALAALCFEPEIPIYGKAIAGVVGVWCLTIFAALIASRFVALPQWIKPTLAVWCIAVPVAFLLGSFDQRILSGLEIGASLVLAAYSWLTWRAYASFRVSKDVAQADRLREAV